MTHTLHISWLTWLLLAAVPVLLGTFALWHWLRSRRLVRFVGVDEQERDYADTLPSVSVIVDAGNDTGQLMTFLPLVLHQDYPAPLEVIVVADGSAESVGDLLSEMKAAFAHLHVTFTPSDTRSLSRKKLALMIGIKAARNEVVLTTNACCRVASDQWLRLMMRNFTAGTDVVLGYSHYRYRHDRGVGRFYRVFDTVSTGTQWLCSAIAGRPYRGVSDNLAYRRRLFFENNGFARSMNLRWGDDDVFVSEIAGRDNTRVEIAPETQVVSHYDNVPHTHRVLKMRRDFTSRQGRRAAFAVQGLMSAMWYAGHAAAIAAVAMNARNLFVVLTVTALVLVAWTVTAVAVRKACAVLQAPRLLLSVPLFALWRPVVNLVYRFREARTRKSNYTTYL